MDRRSPNSLYHDSIGSPISFILKIKSGNKLISLALGNFFKSETLKIEPSTREGAIATS